MLLKIEYHICLKCTRFTGVISTPKLLELFKHEYTESNFFSLKLLLLYFSDCTEREKAGIIINKILGLKKILLDINLVEYAGLNLS